MDNKYLLTAYDCYHNKNSIIYVLDKDTNKYIKKELDTDAHVGGIAFDPVHENIWICDNDGYIAAYSKEEIISYHKKIYPKFCHVYVGDKLTNCFGETSVAYITFNDNKLYVGNYNTKHNSIIKEYNINDYGMIDTDNYNEIKISSFNQGITFYEEDNNKYIITSSSFGKFFPSKLRIYNYNDSDEIKRIQTREMMEEIIIDDDKLITLYESNASIYKTTNKSHDLVISDINKVIKLAK